MKEENQYLKSLEYKKQTSKNTLKVYSYFVSQYLNSVPNPENASSEEISIFLNNFHEYSSKSMNLVISALKFFYREIIPRTEIISFLATQKKINSPNVLSRAEVKKLIDSASTKKSRLIVSLLYSTGIKSSEIISLKRKDFDLNNKKIYLISGEYKKEIPLNEKLHIMLEDFLAYHSGDFLLSGSKPLTQRNIQKIIKTTAQKAGFSNKITPYTLKCSLLSHLSESCANESLVKSFLGNSSKIQPIELETLRPHLNSLL